MTINDFKGVFKSRYPILIGKDWIKNLEIEDLQVFIRMGLAATDYGKKGGQARSAQAKRDKNGRFIKS
jgi:hypothetical protein